jgi:hypothetical protein
MKPRWLFLPVLVVLVSGCSKVLDVFIGNHENSYQKKEPSPPIVTLEYTNYESQDKQKREQNSSIETNSVEAAAAGLAVKLILDQTERAISLEAEKYSQTYSARTSGIIQTEVIGGQKVGDLGSCDPKDKNKRNSCLLTGFKFERNINTRCQNETRNAITVEGAFDYSPNGEAILIKLKSVDLKYTKSKVAGCSLAPWHLPASVVVGLWRLFDSEATEVDLNVQISLDAVGLGQGGVPSLIKLGTFDFPLGKFSLDRLKKRENLENFNTGYIPLPKTVVDKVTNSKISNPILPINLTVSVMESNELGDVIGKGVESFRENKQKAGEMLVERIR